ncbi:MAG TPA: PAS domain S-box protein, partial [Steroidobacteraceae bacterium]
AERGLLILSRGAESRIEAEATTGDDTVRVQLCDLPVTATVLPETVLHWVMRTRESVILNDGATHPSFAADPYIRQVQARSILCLPLINQANLVGALYLENNLTPRAFAPSRIAVLKLLASQAAISLENTRLYRDLAEREARIRRLVDANIIGIAIFKLDGQIIEANEAFLAMVGYSRDDLLSGQISYTGMTPPEWQTSTRGAMEQVKVSGSCKPYEKEYERKDGSRVPVLVGAALFEGSENQGVAFVLDLTERKRAEQAVREREAKIQRLVDSNIIGIGITKGDGEIVEANDAFLKIVEYDREDLVAGRLHWTDLTPSDWQHRSAQALAEVESTGIFKPFEKEYHRKDGSRAPVLIGGAAFDEERQQLVCFVLDLTERKQAEQELRTSEARFRTFVDHATDAFMLHSEDGTILDVNRQACESSGYSRDELIGKAPIDFDPDANAAFVQNINERLGTGETVSFESRNRRKDGTLFPVEVRVREFRQGGQRLGISLTRDITERKRTEAEARESERRYREVQMELAHVNRVATMGQLTASIAHEVTQPIAAVRTNAAAALRFLSRNTPDLGGVREALGCVVEDSDRAGDIVHRIRALVKKEPPQKARFNINDVINELIVLTRSEVVAKGVTVQLRLAEGLSSIQGDRVQLQQVVLNLILNAVEAMSSVDDTPRELSITTELTGADEAVVAVRDSGPGIEPEHLERVFDSFYTTKPSGMGLGLSICRSIIDAHGGRLWADANEPGGAVFQFTVPVANKDHELAGGLPASTAFCTQPARSLSPNGLRMRIETKANFQSFLAGRAMPELDPTVLVIDDDPAVRESLGRLLRSVGLDARLFASVPDLLESERPNGPTCLVVDVNLQEGSGLDFQREIAAADVQIPIIFITAHGDIPMSVEAMKRGAIEFLTKPCHDHDLIAAIKLGLARDHTRCVNEKALSTLRARFESLSPREREIMIQVVQGRLSKQIAFDIGSSEATVNVHRSNLMRKMDARSLPELGRVADQLKLLSGKA